MPRSLAYEPAHALNAICPYFTMFPLEYPLRVLQKHEDHAPVVLDPFCGRGTTLYAARVLGLDAWGIDTSPVAVAIAKAKLANCRAERVLALAERIIQETELASVPESRFFKTAFHRSTLRDICALREGLQKLETESAASTLLRAATLGCLHGPRSKSADTASYFSNQAPRTFAPKPDYSVRYWRAECLAPPKVSVLQVLKRKLTRLAGLANGVGNRFRQVRRDDSRLPRSIPKAADNFGVVVTSPPYYGMRTYVQDQWLRNWFLGGPDYVDYSAGEQLDHGTKSAFVESLGEVWANMSRRGAPDLHMYVRFGSIPSAASDAKRIMLDSLESSGVDWRVVSIRQASTADAGKRQARQMQAGSIAETEFDLHVVRR